MTLVDKNQVSTLIEARALQASAAANKGLAAQKMSKSDELVASATKDETVAAALTVSAAKSAENARTLAAKRELALKLIAERKVAAGAGKVVPTPMAAAKPEA